MEFKYKNVLILGYGVSGKAVEEVLLNKNINYKIFDNNINLKEDKFVKKISRKMLQNFDLVVLSPGISVFSKYVKLAKRLKIEVISEIEFASFFCNKYIIAVTGTNGKTTTVNLINHIFTNLGVKTELVGNIGTPFSLTYKSDAIVSIVEVSSFQLEAIKNFKPNIAVLLNIDCDHIDRHKSYQNYCNTKFEIFKNQSSFDYAIINKSVSELKGKSKISNDVQKLIINDHIYVKDNIIYLNKDNERIKLCNISKFKHINTCMDNILASILVCFVYGLNLKDVINEICSFKVSGNRLQIVKNVNDVTYINDSKSTNIHSTKYALNALQGKDIVLMIGGFDKKLNFETFFNNIPNNVIKVVLFGQVANRLEKICKKCKYFNYVKFDKLIDAIEYCKANAPKNSYVLFSPANSSFDEFESYKKRGDFFIENI